MLDHADCHSQLVADDGRRFPIALGRSTVGREVDCQMRLSDPTVGRHHATLDASPTSVTVTDLQSTNGTWVNDRRVDTTDLVALRHGDVLRLGATRLHFVEPATASGVEHTTVMGSGPSAQPQTPVHGTPQVAVGNQNADQLNNVIGSQYNQYLKTVVEQRAQFPPGRRGEPHSSETPDLVRLPAVRRRWRRLSLDDHQVHLRDQ